MPTLLSVLALIAAAALAPPSGAAVAVDAADERHPAHLGGAPDSLDISTEASRLDLTALTADWEDGP